MNKKAQTLPKQARLNEETLEKVIQSILQEGFPNEEQGKLVSTNFQITMEEIKTLKGK